MMMISKARSFAALGIVCGLFGCSAGSLDQDPAEAVAETSSELVQSETASLTITSSWDGGFCATVNVKNTNLHSATTQSWSVKFDMYSSTFTNGWEGTFSQSAATLTISNSANNKNIAPTKSATPAPGFCANRPVGTPLPTFITSSGVGNYCGTAYRDADGDGWGTTADTKYACDTPAGYVAKSGDCCEMDARAYPGETAFYTSPNACGNFNYACSGSGVIKEVYGPTGCAEAPMTCTLSADKSRCIASAPPSQCNGAFTSYTPGECGQDWYYSTKGCSRVCTGSGCFCTTFSTGGPGGTQRCR